MSGWTDPKVIAEMDGVLAEAGADKSAMAASLTEAERVCALLAGSSSARLRTVGRLTKAFADVAATAFEAKKCGDTNGLYEITDGMLVAMAGMYAGLLVDDDPAVVSTVRRRFETYLEISLVQRKAAKKGCGK